MRGAGICPNNRVTIACRMAHDFTQKTLRTYIRGKYFQTNFGMNKESAFAFKFIYINLVLPNEPSERLVSNLPQQLLQKVLRQCGGTPATLFRALLMKEPLNKSLYQKYQKSQKYLII